MFVEQQLVLHIGEKQVSKSSRRAVTALQTGDWKPSSCAYLSGWHQTLYYKHKIRIWFGLGIKDQQKEIGPEMFEEKLCLEAMPPLAPHRLEEWAGYRTGCLKVRERGLPCNAKVYVVHGALCTDTIQPLSASDPKHARLKSVLKPQGKR